MVKKESLKSVFENVIMKTQKCFFGFRTLPIDYYSIEISNGDKNVFISLYAASYFTSVKICLARSYPMSYKSAYRLVCSL